MMKTGERTVIARILNDLEKIGWVAYKCDVGGEEFVQVNDHAETIDTIDSVDDCRVYFRKGGLFRLIYFVLGNAPDGSEVAAIWPFDIPEFDEVIEKATEM